MISQTSPVTISFLNCCVSDAVYIELQYINPIILNMTITYMDILEELDSLSSLDDAIFNIFSRQLLFTTKTLTFTNLNKETLLKVLGVKFNIIKEHIENALDDIIIEQTEYLNKLIAKRNK